MQTSDQAAARQYANDLERYFYENTGRVIHKWLHYFEIYDRHFAAFRNRPVTIVEIGVNKGGSLQMWKNYFGAQAHIYGIDINPDCRRLAEERIEIMIGSQSDRSFLRSVAKSIPHIDILIDDGGHTMEQQITTFEELYPHIQPHGVYLCEDLHTSYWKKFGGSYRGKNTFIEFSKHLIDQLNAWHSEKRKFGVDDFTRSTHSMHFYDSVLVIEKRPMSEPSHVKKGVDT